MPSLSTPQADLTYPWPRVGDLVRSEVRRFLATYSEFDPDGPSGCPAWSLRDVTVHLATTFERFDRMLVQARSGNLQPPFPRDELTRRNQELIDGFRGDPAYVLCARMEDFLDRADSPDELTAHLFGPISVGLQERFHLVELTLHHDDLLSPTGQRYVPSPEVVDAVAPVWEKALVRLVFNESLWDDDADPWDNVLRASGRPTPPR